MTRWRRVQNGTASCDSGSIAAAAAHGFLPYAMLAAAVLAVVVRRRRAPSAPAAGAVTLLALLAVWAGISPEWSPVPSLARDEGLLTAFYAIALALPLVALRTRSRRLAALGLTPAVLAVLTLAAAVDIGLSSDATRLFDYGRLYFPITRERAGALFAVGVLPARVASRAP